MKSANNENHLGIQSEASQLDMRWVAETSLEEEQFCDFILRLKYTLEILRSWKYERDAPATFSTSVRDSFQIGI